ISGPLSGWCHDGELAGVDAAPGGAPGERTGRRRAAGIGRRYAGSECGGAGAEPARVEGRPGALRPRAVAAQRVAAAPRARGERGRCAPTLLPRRGILVAARPDARHAGHAEHSVAEPSGARRVASAEAVPRRMRFLIAEPSGARRVASAEAVPRRMRFLIAATR